MIDLKELRLYNWIYDPLYHKVQIHCINCFDTYYDRFEPIPITPEILEKAGFVHEVRKYSDHYVLNKERPNGKIDCLMKIGFNETGIAYVHLTGIFGTRIPKTKYLHQLQNLYFALTGTELEINL